MAVEMTETQYLKPKDIAKELDVSVTTIWRLINSGELESVQVGTQWRVNRSAYEQWKQEHSNQERA